MLQLPTASPSRFTKAQVAEINRGGKVKVSRKSKTDPIIAEIKRADRALQRLLDAIHDRHRSLEKLEKRDRGFVTVGPIDETPIFREFGHGFVFSSEDHVARMFRIRRRNARQRLAEDRKLLKRNAAKGLTPSLELTQRIDAEKRLIVALTKFENQQRVAVCAETKRLYRVQKAAGLLAARKRQHAALEAVKLATIKVGNMKPINSEGALAVIKYVQRRIFPDMADLFTDERGTDGQLWLLLLHAYEVMTLERGSWVRGHNGHAGNERADHPAARGIREARAK